MILFGLCKERIHKIPQSLEDWAKYEATLKFKVGPYIYTPLEVQHLIIRCGLHLPSFLINGPYFTSHVDDPKFNFKSLKVNPLVNFGLSFPYKSSPPLRVYVRETLEENLKESAGILLTRSKLIKNKNQLQLPAIFELYKEDFSIITNDCIDFVTSCLPEEFLSKNKALLAAW